jgi:hypothetical protein
VPQQLKWPDKLGAAWPGVRVQYYDLLDRYDKRSEFRWRAVFRLFATALQTGVLRMPESAMEGRLSLTLDAEGRIVSMRDSIWLIPLFRSLKVKNRRLARDMLLWHEIRQPAGTIYSDWDQMMMSDLQIDSVPDMGQFDVDGLSDEGRNGAYATVFLIMAFCMVVLLSFGFSYGLVHMQQLGSNGHLPDSIAVFLETD